VVLALVVAARLAGCTVGQVTIAGDAGLLILTLVEFLPIVFGEAAVNPDGNVVSIVPLDHGVLVHFYNILVDERWRA
jgi:hypothetical protein